MSYVYVESERWKDADGSTRVLYTVGFYEPNGKWHPDSDHSDREEAAKRVAWLNGYNPSLEEALNSGDGSLPAVTDDADTTAYIHIALIVALYLVGAGGWW